MKIKGVQVENKAGETVGIAWETVIAKILERFGPLVAEYIMKAISRLFEKLFEDEKVEEPENGGGVPINR